MTKTTKTTTTTTTTSMQRVAVHCKPNTVTATRGQAEKGFRLAFYCIFFFSLAFYHFGRFFIGSHALFGNFAPGADPNMHPLAEGEREWITRCGQVIVSFSIKKCGLFYVNIRDIAYSFLYFFFLQHRNFNMIFQYFFIAFRHPLFSNNIFLHSLFLSLSLSSMYNMLYNKPNEKY